MPLNLRPGTASGTLMATAKQHEIWSAWRGGTMLGSVFSLPRDVTFGHSRQWSTMKGPTFVLGGHGRGCWAQRK